MSLILALLPLVFVTMTNGEIDICFKVGCEAKHYSISSKEIPTLLDKIRQQVDEPILETGAIYYADFHLNFSHPAINIEGNMSNGWIIISSMPLWRFFTIVSEGIEIFNLTITNMHLNGSYDLGGYIGKHRLFDIYGKGDFFINMSNLSLSVVSSLSVNSSSWCLPITIKLFVNSCQSNFEKLMDGDIDLDPLLNGVIQEILPDAIRIIFKEQAELADPYIQAMINKILHSNESLSRLLHLLITDSDRFTQFVNQI